MKFANFYCFEKSFKMNRMFKKQKTLSRLSSTFSGSKRGDFFQPKPEITNQFLEDAFMVEQLKLEIPEPVCNQKLIFKFKILKYKTS